MTQISQRNATRNQSTADYTTATLFIFDNRYMAGIFKNNTGGSFTLKRGMLIARDTAVPNGFVPVSTVADNLADIIGVCAVEEDVVLANNGTVNVNICIHGTVDGTNLVMPAGVTLNTVEGTKTVKDIMQAIGLVVDVTACQNTKHDN